MKKNSNDNGYVSEEESKNTSEKCLKMSEEYQKLSEETKILLEKISRAEKALRDYKKKNMKNIKSRLSLPKEGKLRLFNEAELFANAKAPDLTEKSLAAENSSQRNSESCDGDLFPVENCVFGFADSQKICKKCNSKLKLAGKKFCGREIEILPNGKSIIDNYYEIYTCENCNRKTGRCIETHLPSPLPLIKNSMASPATIANVLTLKYAKGVPLSRQEKTFRHDGIDISKEALSNWVIQIAQTWLKPLYRQLRHHLLAQRVILSDYTRVQTVNEGVKDMASESRMWVYTSGENEANKIRYYEYQPERSGKTPAVLLKNYDGFLVTRECFGNDEYCQVSNAVRCSCWVHMLSKWNILSVVGDDVSKATASTAQKYCNGILNEEYSHPGNTAAQRKSCRQAYVEPIADTYWNWIEKLEPEPGSELEDVIQYAKNQKKYLNEFISHGEASMHNGAAKDAIFPFRDTENGWLIDGTSKGAESSAIIYSLIESAKANNLDPYEYLFTVLNEMRIFGKTTDNAVIDQFLPWTKKMRNAASILKT